MRFLLTTALVLLVAAAWLSWTAVEDVPLVAEGEQIGPEELRRARQFLRDKLDTGQDTTLELSESDLALLTDTLLDQWQGGASRFELEPGQMRLELSAMLPEGLPGTWLNLSMTLLQAEPLPRIGQLQLGRLKVAPELANPALSLLHDFLRREMPEYGQLLQAVRSWAFLEGQLRLDYALQAESLALLSSTGRDLLVDPALAARLQVYTEQVVMLAARETAPRASLMAILPELLQFARSRGGDAGQENHAALIALTLYQFDVDAARLLGDDISAEPRPRGVRYMLHNRYDMAEHFLGSAALSLSADSALADYLGLLKELDDSRLGGSGFSFVDLAADRTGIRFAALAAGEAAQASRIQEYLSGVTDENVLMPDFTDLPEFFDEETFRQSYGTPESADYQAVIEQIEARLDSSPLYQSLP